MPTRPASAIFPEPIIRVLALMAFACGVVFTGGSAVVHAQHPTAVTSIVNSDQDTTLEVNHNGSLLIGGNYLPGGTPAPDSIPAEGAGTRMVWFPANAAFRAGRVEGTQWDGSNIGLRSMAVGYNTVASGPDAVAVGREVTAGGFAAVAMGRFTEATGDRATAMGDKTKAGGNQATAMGRKTSASGAQATAMGLGTTAATNQSVSVGACNNANSGTSGDGTLFVAGNGTFDASARNCDIKGDALVLKEDGDLAVGPSDPMDLRLFVRDEKDNVGVKDNPSGNMVLFKNTSSGSKPDVMGLQAGPSSPGNGVAYLTFYDKSGTTVGQIEGNGSGGINVSGDGADFAEELPVAEGTAKPEPADLVGVHGGSASLKTKGADRLMIASTAPIMTGNAPSSMQGDAQRVAVAFVGQVPAKVRGEVDVGDLIVGSGKGDGTARGISPGEYRRSQHGMIAGQAWSSKMGEGVGEVTVAVGLGRDGAVAAQLKDQRSKIADLRAENRAIKERLAALEETVSTSDPVMSSLMRPWGLGLLVGLGGICMGLLWRRR